MYFVKYGNDYLHDPRIGLCLPSAKLQTEVNTSDVFTFTIPVTHELYDVIKERDQDNSVTVLSGSTIMFRGEVSSVKTDFYLTKTVECRGELAYLNDSIVRPYSTEEGEVSRLAPSTVDGYFEFLIEEHNSQSDKKFEIGVNEGELLDPNNVIHRADTTYPNVGATIKDKILKMLGGYLKLDYNEDGTRTISLLEDFPTFNAQTVDFGVNLLDYVKENDFSDAISFVVPVGKAVDDGDNKTIDERLTVKGEKDKQLESGYYKEGDMIYSEKAVERYGWVGGVVEFDDVTKANLLVTKGLASLKELEQGTVTIEIKAIDLSMIKPNYDPITIGQYVRVCSKPHSFDSYMLVSKIVFDLIKPDNDTFTLGTVYTTLTGMSNTTISALNSTINGAYQSASKSASDMAEAKNAAEEAKEAAAYATSTVGDLAERVGNAESFISTVNDSFIEFEYECEEMRTVFESERIGIRDAFDSEVAQMNADFEEFKQQVTEAGVADGAVTTEKLADGAVTADKVNLPPLNFSESGNGLGIGCAAPEDGLDVGLNATFLNPIKVGSDSVGVTYQEINNGGIVSHQQIDSHDTSRDSNIYNVIGGSKDSRGYFTSYMQSSAYKNGDIAFDVGARCRNAGDTANITNIVSFRANPNGTRSIAVSNAAAWRNALGASICVKCASKFTIGTSQKKVTMDAVSEIDTTGKLSISNGGVKCEHTGWVRVTARYRAASIPSKAYTQAKIYRNSSEVIANGYGFNYHTSAWYTNGMIDGIVSVSAGDIIYFYINTTSGSGTLFADDGNSMVVTYI